MIWTTFDVKIYIEHIQLPNYPYDVRHELQTYFLVVKTFLAILAFGAILPFVNVLMWPIPYKFNNFHDNNLNAQID